MRAPRDGRHSPSGQALGQSRGEGAACSDAAGGAPQQAESERLGPANGKRGVLETLANSLTFQEYQRAFADMTGLQLALRPPDIWQLPTGPAAQFCALVSTNSGACAACLAAHQRLLESAARQPCMLTCPNGLCLMAAPLLWHEQLVGYLETGEVFCSKPTGAQFARVAKQLASWGLRIPQQKLRKAYFATRHLSARQAAGALTLLALFGQHLLGLAEKFEAGQTRAELPVLARARQYIQAHYTSNLRLAEVARACMIGKFQLCRLFTRSTGTSYADYVSQVRISKAKELLLNPNLRVTEIGFGVGFQSVTHFDRVFKRIMGESPREYRRRLVGVVGPSKRR